MDDVKILAVYFKIYIMESRLHLRNNMAGCGIKQPLAIDKQMKKTMFVSLSPKPITVLYTGRYFFNVQEPNAKLFIVFALQYSYNSIYN